MYGSAGGSGHKGIIQSPYDNMSLAGIARKVEEDVNSKERNELGKDIEDSMKAMVDSGQMPREQYNQLMALRQSAKEKRLYEQTMLSTSDKIVAEDLNGTNPSPTVCYSFPGALRGSLTSALIRSGMLHSSHCMNDNKKQGDTWGDPVKPQFPVDDKVLDFAAKHWGYKRGSVPRWFGEHWGPAAYFAAQHGKGVIIFESHIRRAGGYLPEREGYPNCDLERIFCMTSLPQAQVVCL